MDNEGMQVKYQTRSQVMNSTGIRGGRYLWWLRKSRKKKITRPCSMGRTEINKENWKRNFNFQLQVKSMAFFIMQNFQMKSPQTHWVIIFKYILMSIKWIHPSCILSNAFFKVKDMWTSCCFSHYKMSNFL